MLKCARLSGGTLLSLIALCGGCDSSNSTGKTSTTSPSTSSTSGVSTITGVGTGTGSTGKTSTSTSTSVDTGTSSTSNLTLADLGGRYTLVGFTVAYDTGLVVTGQDISASGTMTIDSAAALMTQTITASGLTGSFTGTDVAVAGNQLRLTDSARSCTYYLGFDFSNEVLTTHMKAGSVCGQYIGYSEDDVWERTSRDTGDAGATALPMVLDNGDQSNAPLKGSVAGALGALVQP